MVKRQHQGSASPEQPKATPVHPLLRQTSQIDDLAEKLRAKKDYQDFQVEELEQWKVCVNSLASSPNGKMLLRAMIDDSGIAKPPKLADPQRMIVNNIKASFYLTWVKPYLEPEVRRDLE